MKAVRFISKAGNEDIKSITIQIGKVLITFALAETIWETKGKKRLIPIWISKKGLFVFKFAMKTKITA